ncbi:protein of unknown function (plasmid) [Shinella sp. WSC3-e]|nr:protein of unknown function [Shinella sp. WSC3-e]
MPMSRSWMGRCVMSRPPTMMLPREGLLRPAMIRSVVVFPHPEGPRKATISPLRTERSSEGITLTAPKLTPIPSSLRCSSGAEVVGMENSWGNSGTERGLSKGGTAERQTDKAFP